MYGSLARSDLCAAFSCKWEWSFSHPFWGTGACFCRDLPPASFSDIGWLLAAALAASLPFLFYRLTSRKLPVFVSALTLPVAGTAVHAFARLYLPAFVSPSDPAITSAIAAHLPPAAASDGLAFVVFWFALALLNIWNRQSNDRRKTLSENIFIALFFLLAIAISSFATAKRVPISTLALICLVTTIVLAIWALFRPVYGFSAWHARTGILDILQSPLTHEPLTLVRTGNHECLSSPTGEQFPILDGVAVVLRPEDLAGPNGKYHKLYEIIGGMYDDSQRVVCLLGGLDRDAYAMSYLRYLETKTGDRVLETSVGSGLNFKYLPRGAHLAGLDLSREMLDACLLNLSRWNLQADLFLGNAEHLPFADNSFDVVFHVGGINFFSDRAQAIKEMIRVAKPGSRILIADETEEHVQRAYEKFPLSGELYKNRTEPVVAPIDLVPPEMQEVHLEIIHVVGKNRFYALTFRKPAETTAEISSLTNADEFALRAF